MGEFNFTSNLLFTMKFFKMINDVTKKREDAWTNLHALNSLYDGKTVCHKFLNYVNKIGIFLVFIPFIAYLHN